MKITAQGLVKAYKGRRVVDGVTFSFDQGEVVGLLGPNGAGKTTTFYMITGLIQPNEGTVLFDDKEVTSWPMYKRARAGVGYLAQESSVFRNLSVRDNIRLVLEAAKKSKKEIEDKVKHSTGSTPAGWYSRSSTSSARSPRAGRRPRRRSPRSRTGRSCR